MSGNGFAGERLDCALDRKLGVEFAELGLNTLLERHHCIRAAAAVSDKTERNRLALHADEFHVAAILLEHGTERIKHCLNLFFERHFLSPEIEKPLNYTKRQSISQQLATVRLQRVRMQLSACPRYVCFNGLPRRRTMARHGRNVVEYRP
jgi:hypothetical protein